jgi:hypothetical protein
MINNTLFEDGNGGQLVLRNNEIVQTASLATLAYLLMFGGNVEAETEKENAVGELKFDWWGNDPNKPSDTWINSRTERILRGIEVSSSSRYKIEEAVKYDVRSLEQYGEVSVEVSFVSMSRVKIVITIAEPSVKNDQSLTLVWEASRNEIIEKHII